MRRGAAFLFAMVIALLVLTIAVFAKYSVTGWKTFECAPGDTCSWTSTSSGGVADLRFKSAMFTVAMPDGTVYTKDVTPVLKGMAVAYEGVANDGILTLVRPLNPFSFVIVGVNDSDTITPTTIPTAWKNAVATLKGQWRTL